MSALKDIHFMFDTSMKVSIISMSCIGLYPLVNRSKFQKIFIIIVKISMFFVMLQFIMILYSLKEFLIVEIADRSASLGMCCLGFVKFHLMDIYGKQYYELVDLLRDKLWTNNPHLISENSINICIGYYKKTKILMYFFAYIALFTMFGFALTPIMVMGYYKLFTVEKVPLLLPFDLWMPFDRERFYILSYLQESIMEAIITWMFFSIDVFNLVIITQVCIHMDCLKEAMVNLVKEEDLKTMHEHKDYPKHPLTKQAKQNTHLRLRGLISRHNEIIEVVKKLEHLIGIVLLLNFILGSIFLCFTGFTFTTVEDIHRKLKFLIFFQAILVAMFDHCLYGQIISDLSQAVPDCLYASSWYLTEQRIQKGLIFVILRAQRPLKLSGLGYVDMNFHSFTKVISTSWSYFTLLKTVYDK